MTAEHEAADAAARFRTSHDLGHQPLGDLVEIIERNTGHDVAVIDAHPDQHGLTVRDTRRGTVFIGVARTTRPMRQRSTLAHELAHVLFGDWSTGTLVGNRSRAEVRADAFARHLLLPAYGLQEFLGEHHPASVSEFSAVVQHFRVSPALAAITLHECKYIDGTTKQSWMSSLTTPALATRFGWLDHYRSLQNDSNRTRSPRRLLARAITGYEEGVVSGQVIATLRGISVEQAIDELERAGIIPLEHDPDWMAGSELDLPPADFGSGDAGLDHRAESE
ncbi:ImmA/IrrE family metallo-endopeptidase [Tomitella gaofuii]|uniref:ImmA/IrrE family metallo-endopeptidase n=1 Tax=Tomitella gaofuii TaxID=2760083 RepID=UPI0015FB1714|nr:ImmA/IrrE family metallo-endopeptidase [Tomitella gaofuii]